MRIIKTSHRSTRLHDPPSRNAKVEEETAAASSWGGGEDAVRNEEDAASRSEEDASSIKTDEQTSSPPPTPPPPPPPPTPQKQQHKQQHKQNKKKQKMKQMKKYTMIETTNINKKYWKKLNRNRIVVQPLPRITIQLLPPPYEEDEDAEDDEEDGTNEEEEVHPEDHRVFRQGIVITTGPCPVQEEATDIARRPSSSVAPLDGETEDLNPVPVPDCEDPPTTEVSSFVSAFGSVAAASLLVVRSSTSIVLRDRSNHHQPQPQPKKNHQISPSSSSNISRNDHEEEIVVHRERTPHPNYEDTNDSDVITTRRSSSIEEAGIPQDAWYDEQETRRMYRRASGAGGVWAVARG